MISDSLKMKYRPTVPRRKAGGTSKCYSDNQKIEAVTTYLMLGNLALVGRTLNIPLPTLKVWKKSEWWVEIEKDLRIQEDLQLSKRMQGILSRSMSVIEDRLDHGDFIYDQKTGELRRKPVGIKDANTVLKDISQRRDVLIDRHVSNESVNVDKVEDTLQKLAKQFAQIASSVKPVQVTDVIFGDDEDAQNEGRKA